MKLTLHTRNRLILAAPTAPALVAGSYMATHPVVATVIVFLTAILIRLIEKKVRIIVRKGKNSGDKNTLVNLDGDTDSHFE